MKSKSLAVAALIGVGLTTSANAGSLEELKQLLNQQDVSIDLALTGDYLYTADRSDSTNADQFAYNTYMGLFKEASNESPFGFGLELSNNEWAPVVGSEPIPSVSSSISVDQAYVEVLLKNFNIKAGRILTNIGGEAPYTWQNINIQRGLVWNGEPVYYNGVRFSGNFGAYGVYVGINDRDTSDGKMALEAGISGDLSQKTSVSFNVLIPDSKDNNPTKVYNLTFTSDYFEKAPITFYVDYLSTPQKGQDAQSIGAAFLVDFKVNNQVSVGSRVEYVNNDGDGDNYGIGTGNNALTFTLTPKYQINKYLYVRGEASYVSLGHKYYNKNDNSKTDSEFRVGAEIGFVF